MSIRIISFFCLIVLATKLFAVRSLTGTWDGMTFTFDENKPFFYYLEAEGRFYNRSEVDAALARVAVGHTIKHFKLWLGYDYFQSLDSRRRTIQAVWQQLFITLVNSNSLEWTYYSRFEERFFSLEPGTAYRNRNQSTLILKNFFPNQISPLLTGELFVNVNHPTWVSRKTISQTRYFIGVQKPITESVMLALGYLNVNVFRNHETVRENIARIRFAVNFE
ncbi:DUF2490 domain-containing protein [Legionella impletisoli]|uniref:DUF2490 domain-containing protein n=1 Tax=Legionella impletisoli TaxID=343510 RepID=A0A917JUT2_9GAMM|nr:DUF2490 domain-containing protein [Legionella impletisoli]GGI88168.1 hypothetical protein GCM10007966_16130 [Legionella impletisoli]